MVICKCYKCYIETPDFILKRDKYGSYQSICLECDKKTNLCLLVPFICFKKIFCCGKKSSETLTEAKNDIEGSLSSL
jgi:hypothetical protein